MCIRDSLRIDLGGENIGVPQHLRYGLQRYALRERDGRGKRVAGHMHRDMLFQPAIPCDTLQCAVHVVAGRRHGKDEVVFRYGTVVFDQLFGNRQQFDMEMCIRDRQDTRTCGGRRALSASCRYCRSQLSLSNNRLIDATR